MKPNETYWSLLLMTQALLRYIHTTCCCQNGDCQLLTFRFILSLLDNLEMEHRITGGSSLYCILN
jgi:hypothetical protein